MEFIMYIQYNNDGDINGNDDNNYNSCRCNWHNNNITCCIKQAR